MWPGPCLTTKITNLKMDATIPVDLTLFPTVFDVLHVGLAGLSGLLLLIIAALVFALLAALKKTKSTPLAAVAPSPPTLPVAMKQAGSDAALQLLGLLQAEARFIDFIEEDVAAYADADIGAAARVVHQGCRKVLKEHFQLEPVRVEAEGSRVTLPKGFDASAVRLTGNIVGAAPFSGTLMHRGWRASAVTLPKVTEGHDLKILAPAEVEL